MYRSAMFKNILVVCIGNICRSPVAEALLLSRFNNETKQGISVSSAGIAAMVDHPADPVSQELMMDRGIDISKHRARQLTSEILFGSELILTMSTDQQRQVEETYPGTRGRVYRLGKWSGFDVPDPYQRPKAVFEQMMALIEQGIDEWYRKLWK